MSSRERERESVLNWTCVKIVVNVVEFRSLFFEKKFREREREKKLSLSTLFCFRYKLHLLLKIMSAVAVTPGAVARIRESKEVLKDELNVQVCFFLLHQMALEMSSSRLLYVVLRFFLFSFIVFLCD